MEYVLERLRTRQGNETEDVSKERKRSQFEKEVKLSKRQLDTTNGISLLSLVVVSVLSHM